MNETENLLTVEVVYAEAGAVDSTLVTVKWGTTLGLAIDRSGLLQRQPQLHLLDTAVGVFGRIKNLEDLANDGDRIELYRSLTADPKLARRQRVRIARRKLR
jgi:putative ubiquitin-RnfH superfamily antitoxin RatB of RatAB toxin-antitoxin module